MSGLGGEGGGLLGLLGSGERRGGGSSHSVAASRG